MICDFCKEELVNEEVLHDSVDNFGNHEQSTDTMLWCEFCEEDKTYLMHESIERLNEAYEE